MLIMQNIAGMRAPLGIAAALAVSLPVLGAGAAQAEEGEEALAPVLAAFAPDDAPPPPDAEGVVLRDPAWRGQVRGRLVDHRDGILTLETAMGRLHFALGSVECIGAACPEE